MAISTYAPAIPVIVTKQGLTRQERRFVRFFVFFLIIAFFPYTPPGQVAPLAFIVGIILFVQIRANYHLSKLILVFVGYGVIGFIYWLLYRDIFFWPSYLLFLVTMSSLLIWFMDFRAIASAPLIERLGSITLGFIALESIYGIGQALYMFAARGTFDGSAGDMVWGTLAPSLNWYYRGRMPLFAILLSSLMLFTFATSRKKLPKWQLVAYGIVATCWLLTSLMHSYIFFAVAVVAAVIVLLKFKFSRNKAPAHHSKKVRKKNYGLSLAIFVLLFLGVLGPIFLPQNFGKVYPILSDAFDFGPQVRFIKNRVTYQTIVVLPEEEWLQPLVGLGPGQYSSRAALMVSGEYLQRIPIPFFPEYANPYTRRYILSKIGIINSSIHFPTSSWIAWYGEIGIVGLVVLVFVMFRVINTFRRYQSVRFVRLNLAMLILLFYLFLMGLQNVYWEYTQAVFPSILGMKLCYDYLQRERIERQSWG